MTTLLALVLMGGLPAVAGGAALAARAVGPDRPGVLLTRMLAAGVVTWTMGTGLLARTVGLSTTSVWTLAVALGLVSLVVIALPAQRRALRQGWRDLVQGVGVAALGLLTWAPVALLNKEVTWSVFAPTPWYYLGLARQTAEHGSVPATSMEWGTTAPFLDDYHLLTVGTASLIKVGPADGILAAHAVVFVTVVLGACGIAALCLELGLNRWCAPLAVPLFLAIDVFAVKLSSYRPEIFATTLLFPIAALALGWLRRRDVSALVAGAGLFTVVAEVHGLMLFIAAAMVGGALLSTLVCRSGGRAIWFKRAVVLVISWSLSIAAVALLLGTKVGTEHSGGLQRTSGLDDPTWEFIRAIRGLPSSMPPTNAEMARGSLTTRFWGFDAFWFTVPLVVCVVVLVGTWIAGSASTRRAASSGRRRSLERVPDSSAGPLLLFMVGFTLVSVAFAAVFAFGWPTYVPRRAGDRRLLQVIPMVFPVLAAAAVSVLARTLRSRTAKVGLVCISLVAATILGLVSSSKLAERVDLQHPSQRTVAAMRSADIPRDALVLANGYTEGTIPQLLGARGLLDGRAPYTFPDLLDRANRLLRGAAEFYRNPSAHRDFLVANDVDFVAWARGGTWALGTANLFKGSRRLPRHVPSWLTPVLRTPDIVIYRVD